MPFVYILRCGDGTFYTGATTDLRRRLNQHCKGKGAKYTRGRGPLDLVYWEEKTSLAEAFSREAEIKKLGRIQKKELIREFEEGGSCRQG